VHDEIILNIKIKQQTTSGQTGRMPGNRRALRESMNHQTGDKLVPFQRGDKFATRMEPFRPACRIADP
jgi:hypothetical protein